MSRDNAEVSPVQAILSLAATAGIVLLIPFAILFVGAPVALALRLIVDAFAWLAGAVFGW